MEKSKHQNKAWLGIVLVIVGLAFLTDNLHFFSWHIPHYIFGWKMLFILIGGVMLATGRRSGFIFLLIGGFFIVPDILGISGIYIRNWWPLILIAVGISFLLRRSRFGNTDSSGLEGGSDFDITSILSGRKHVVDTENFGGGEITAFCGGSEIDLSKAKLGNTPAVIDMFVCNYNSVSESGEIINTSKYRSAQYSGADSLKIFVENHFNPAPWNKIYRKELFVNNNLEFPDKIAYQDFATIPLLTERAKKITVISNVLYNYVQNPHGYSHTATDIHTYSIFKAFEIIYKHFKLYSPNSLKSDLFRQIVVGRFIPI